MHIQELKELAMSRIDDLIAEYCSDGVEFHSISEIFDLKMAIRHPNPNWSIGRMGPSHGFVWKIFELTGIFSLIPFST